MVGKPLVCNKAQIPLHRLEPKLPRGKVHKSRKSRTQIKVGEMICVRDFHRTFPAGKFRWKSQSRHNGI